MQTKVDPKIAGGRLHQGRRRVQQAQGHQLRRMARRRCGAVRAEAGRHHPRLELRGRASTKQFRGPIAVDARRRPGRVPPARWSCECSPSACAAATTTAGTAPTPTSSARTSAATSSSAAWSTSAPASPSSREGDRVVAPFVCGCGECEPCRLGQHQVCRRQEQPGFTRWGAFAEYTTIPYAATNAVRVPDGVADEAAALVGLPGLHRLPRGGRTRSARAPVRCSACTAAVAWASPPSPSVAPSAPSVVAVDVAPDALDARRRASVPTSCSTPGSHDDVAGGGARAAPAVRTCRSTASATPPPPPTPCTACARSGATCRSVCSRPPPPTSPSRG